MPLDFPEFCIRGIEKLDYINTVDDTAKLTLYLPDSRTAADRIDKGIEDAKHRTEKNANNFLTGERMRLWEVVFIGTQEECHKELEKLEKLKRKLEKVKK